jgi:hypothetical protein
MIDTAGLFALGNKLVGGDFAEFRVMPAGKNFKPSQLTGSQFHQGLEDGKDLVLLQRALDVGRIEMHGNPRTPIMARNPGWCGSTAHVLLVPNRSNRQS